MCVCVIDHAAMLCNMFYNMESQRGQNPIIMDLHNWIMDLHNWIMEIHNSNYGIIQLWISIIPNYGDP